MSSARRSTFVAGVRARPETAGLFVDFDGTLAAIVADPGRARPESAAVEAVVSATGILGDVAVVSGRPVEFLARWFPDPVRLVGLYGLEERIDGSVTVHAEAQRWASAVRRVTTDARNRFPSDAVESKGLSLTVHHRNHPELEQSIAAWARAAADESGLESRPARMSWELHPPLDADKGTVVAARSAGLERVVYIGDDVGDLPAFAALDRLAAGGVETLKLAVDSEGLLLDRVRTVVDEVLAGPAATVEFIQSLVAADN